MAENLKGIWSNQQPLGQQHQENARNDDSYQSSSDEMTLEDILVRYGVVKKGNSSRTNSSRPSQPTKYNASNAQNDSCQTSHEDVMTFEDFLVKSGALPKEYGTSHTTSLRSPPSPKYDPSSIHVGAEGTSVGPMESGAAQKDHRSRRGMLCEMEGQERRVGHEDHQSPGNIMSKVCPRGVRHDKGGRMVTMGIGVQQAEVGDGNQLGIAMRGISLGGGGGSSGIKGMGPSASAMAVDKLSIEPEPPYNDKGMGGNTSDKKKCKENKATDKEMEKKKKNMIKNRESASRSRARKEAYRMELERMVSQLTEENARLKRALEELTAKPANINAGKTGALRRCNSSPL